MDHFVAQMYACNLLEDKVLYDWEESDNKLWGAKQPHFTKQCAKERNKLARNKSNKSYESSAAFRERPRPRTIKATYNASTSTTADGTFVVAMEYAAELEE